MEMKVESASSRAHVYNKFDVRHLTRSCAIMNVHLVAAARKKCIFKVTWFECTHLFVEHWS